MFYHPRRSLVLRALLILSALLATPFLVHGCADAWDAVLPPRKATLVIISDASLRDVTVRYDGRDYAVRPRLHGTGDERHVLVPNMRPMRLASTLDVAWRTDSGRHAISVVLDAHDSEPPICVMVLRLDGQGLPILPSSPRSTARDAIAVRCGDE